MDGKLAALLGAVAGVAMAGPVHAAAGQVSAAPGGATSYADLLAPIIDPVEQLKADDAVRAQAPVRAAQYYYYGPPDYYYRHHHHHHHHGVWFGPDGVYIR